MKAPFGIVTAVTYRCNLRCKHCFAGSPSLDQKKLQRDEMLTAHWINFFDQIAGMGVHEIYLGGGEPFVRDDILTLIKEARARDIGTTLTTNGTLLGEDTIKTLRDLGVECVEISIDGTQPTHDYLRGIDGAYKKSLAALNRFARHNIYVIASVTVSDQNVTELEDIFHDMKNAGAREVLYMRFVPVGTGKSYRNSLYISEGEFRDAMLDLMEKLEGPDSPGQTGSDPENYFWHKVQAASDGYFYPHSGCIGGRSYCFVRPNGNVTPCNPLVFPEYQCGNITETPFADIWHHSPGLQRIRQLDFNELPQCSACENIDVCAGGCRIICDYYRHNCTRDCTSCQWQLNCNEASGMCGKKYMYYVRTQQTRHAAR